MTDGEHRALVCLLGALAALERHDDPAVVRVARAGIDRALEEHRELVHLATTARAFATSQVAANEPPDPEQDPVGAFVAGIGEGARRGAKAVKAGAELIDWATKISPNRGAPRAR